MQKARERLGEPADIARWHNLSAALNAEGYFAYLSKREGEFAPSALEQQRAVLALELGLSPSKLAVPHQVHGNAVEVGVAGLIHEATDGLITRDPQVVLTLQVADCAPVYLLHEPTGTRGLAHVGWRGAAAGIIAEAVNLMAANGAAADEIVTCVGPCIEQSCYEVGSEVRRQFDADLAPANDNDRYQLDMRGVIHHQLMEAGVRASNIDVSAVCTSCDLSSHSYRRDGAQAGRMIAFYFDQSALA